MDNLREARTTINPDKVLHVDDAEYTDLQRMGILIKEDAKDESAAKPEGNAVTAGTGADNSTPDASGAPKVSTTK